MTFYSRLSILCLGMCIALSGCSSDKNNEQQAPKAPPPLPVEIITVQNEKVPIWLEYTGKTEATQRIEVRARVSGTLEQVLFKDGQAVSKGQKLFVIEKDTYQAAVDQAKAKLEHDQASLSLAVTDVERYKPLVAKDLAPRATLDQYKAKVNELKV